MGPIDCFVTEPADSSRAKNGRFVLLTKRMGVDRKMDISGRGCTNDIETCKKIILPFKNCMEKAMEKLIPGEEINEISGKVWDAFISLLPEVPYIGGERNPLNANLIGAAYEMCFYTLMEERGYDPGQISAIDQRASREITRMEIAAFGLDAARGDLADKEKLKEGAEFFKQSGFPDNWIYEVVEPGENDNFDIGINYTRCPIVTLFKKHGKEKYLPYICANDFPVFAEMGVSLERTQTMGNGAVLCDFRFKLGVDPKSAIQVDVEHLPEFREVCG